MSNTWSRRSRTGWNSSPVFSHCKVDTFLGGVFQLSHTRQAPSYLSLVESLEAVADGEHFVAFGDSHSDSRTYGGVHTCRRGADVQHGNIKGALWGTESSSHTHTHAEEPDTCLLPHPPAGPHCLHTARAESYSRSRYDTCFQEDGISATFGGSEDKPVFL